MHIRESSSIVVIFVLKLDVLLPDIILGKKLLLIAFAYLLQVLKESFKLYRAINDGIINLVDKVSMIQILLSTFGKVMLTLSSGSYLDATVNAVF